MSTRVLYDMKKRKMRYRVLSVDTVADLQSIDSVEGGFVLLLVDPTWEKHRQAMSDLAYVLLHKNLRYFCAWADGRAEGLHDLFDRVRFDGNFEADGTCIMTTWHDKDSLTEAVWYFLNCAEPVAPFDLSCRNWIAAVVGNKDQAASVVDSIQTNLGLFPKGFMRLDQATQM